MSKTVADNEHMRWVGSLGCIVCLENGYEDSPSDLHHTGTGGGGRKKHLLTVPLCPPHHRWKDTVIKGKERREVEARLLAYVAEHCPCNECKQRRR